MFHAYIFFTLLFFTVENDISERKINVGTKNRSEVNFYKKATNILTILSFSLKVFLYKCRCKYLKYPASHNNFFLLICCFFYWRNFEGFWVKSIINENILLVYDVEIWVFIENSRNDWRKLVSKKEHVNRRLRTFNVLRNKVLAELLKTKFRCANLEE